MIQVLQKNTSMWTLRLLRIGHTRFYMDFFTCIIMIHQSYNMTLNVTVFVNGDQGDLVGILFLTYVELSNEQLIF